MTLAWHQIPGWFNFEDIYLEAVDRAPRGGAHFVEVGVLFGRSTLFMADAIARSGKSISFDAVDNFDYGPEALSAVLKKYAEKCPGNDLSLLPSLHQEIKTKPIMAIVRDHASLSGLAHLVNLVRSSGQDQASRYEDEGLDFVFVDSAHTYEDTRSMLLAYLPKLRRGGVLAGHDYHPEYPGVIRAVHELLGEVDVRCISFSWRKP